MHLGLFIPCYIDAFFPEVGVATLELLERLGCSVGYRGVIIHGAQGARSLTVLLLSGAAN